MPTFSQPAPAVIRTRIFPAAAVLFALVFFDWKAAASLERYDASIASDYYGSGQLPLAKLQSAVTLSGSNRAAFNFGAVSGDASIEFILEGDPRFSAGSAYLAVGANFTSNLRYEQNLNTGQLGFTQLGVLDYLFSPIVLSPEVPTHVAFLWSATAGTMNIYINGALAGSRSGVSAGFAMPAGQGFLGANPGNTENMKGTIYRVTVYDELLTPEAIRWHADAFLDVPRPPAILQFSATPPAILSPGSSVLIWNTRDADALFLNALDVTGMSNFVVAPMTNTTYVLAASNQWGTVSAQLTVLVDPPPIIHSFRATRTFLAPGDATTFNWRVSYGQDFSILPGVGDVIAQTENGIGSISVQPLAAGTYQLLVGNQFGSVTAELQIEFAQPADHLVISEFMAADDSLLADEDGEFSGWIELFNPTAREISLAGHYLTDERSNSTKWSFPSHAGLAPGAYLLVFASGKDRTNSPLHANFRLFNAGEYLALVAPGPVLVHAYGPFPPQRPNISYGILAGDPAREQYMGVPTPGGLNSEEVAPPAAVQFSVPSGTFTNALEVSLSTVTPGAQIRFTLDGSSPSATHGFFYDEALLLTNTTRLRAVAVESSQFSPVSGAAYIKLSSELAAYQSSLPILVIENFGAGVIPQKGWNGNGAGIRQVPRQDAVWATFDRENGQSSLAAAPQMFSRIGIRGRGAFSTQWRQKPFSVEALDQDGNEREVRPLGMPAHADWVLYFPDPDDNKDPTLLFNTFAYDLSRASGRYSVRFRFVEAFVNEDGGELRLADRRGVYVLLEKVSRGKDRLDFQQLSEDGSAGSWLVNINRMDPEPDTGWPAVNGAMQPWFFHTAGPNRVLETPANALVLGDDEPQQANAFINFDNPNGYVINTNQRAAIESWFKQFEDVLWSNALWRDPTNGYRKYLDAKDFVDYFILNVLTRNGDGLLISMFPWKGDDGKLRMGPAWDYNWNPYYISGTNATGSLYHRADRLWYRRLFADPDFLQLYIDRWWDMRRGPFSNAAMEQIVDAQANEITTDKALLNGLPTVVEWTNRLARMKSWLTQRANWIDGNYVRPPFFNVPGGEVPGGFNLVIVGTNGTIYFTLDGSDPRAPGGAVAASAQAYQGAVPLFTQTSVYARIKNGTNWSGLTSAIFYTPQDLSALAITEIMYHPAPFGLWGTDDLEFLELKNTGTNTLHLGSLTFAAGISFTFANGTRLSPGEFFVLARNAAAFQERYPGVAINGVYTGRLDNGGESLRLVNSSGFTIFEVTYNDRDPWPVPPDGYGFSLVPRSLADNSDNGAHWRASANSGGSPGADDPEPASPSIRINELLTHTDPPLVDMIELFNPMEVDADIGGWFLSDDGALPMKFRIPDGAVIPANGYLIFTEADFNPTPGTLLNFSLDSAGDSLYLCAGDAQTNLTGYAHSVSFGAAANGVSFGRYVNSVGEEHFPAQLANTFGDTNAGPIIGPVVMQEIQYHPEPGGDEFLELRNITAEEVLLYDPAYPTNTWRVDGLGFSFPPGITLASNALLLIVDADPEAFRAKYSIPAGVQIVGPFLGALQDNGERLELQRPDLPDTNGVAYIDVDVVRYNDKAPWPPGADGGGPSLQRVNSSQYGNDPANWRAASPTPGADFVPGAAPVITLQPQNQTVSGNQSASFSVAASGTGPLLVQWLFNGRPVAGASSFTLTLDAVQPSQAGIYSAIVYNSEGSVTSDGARLTVLFPPGIQFHPQSVTTNAGRPVSFSVSAYGVGALRYQWLFEGTVLERATNSTLTFTNVQASDDGLYSVRVTDAIGSTESQPARLTVLVPAVFVQNPETQTVFAGDTVTFRVQVSGTPPFAYRWRQNNTTVVPFPGSPVLVLTNVPLSFNSNKYDCIVTNPGRPFGIASSPGFLFVLADSDGDRLPDLWEIANGLNHTNAADAVLDADNDLMSNRDEYVAGTDPQDPLSYLKIDRLSFQSAALIEFTAVSNKTYSLQYTDTLPPAEWLKLTDILAAPTNRLLTIPDPAASPRRFYRLITPRAN